MKQNYLKSFCARFLTLLVLALLSTNLAWGEDFSETYSYGNLTGWSLTNYTDASSYYKLPDGTDDPKESIATISGIFASKTVTSDVVVTINCATFGSGDNPIETTFSLYNSSDCTSKVTASKGGDLPTSSTYKNVTYTVNSTNVSAFTSDLVIKITKPGKQIRLKSIKVEFEYTTGPAKTLTSVEVSGNPTKTTYYNGDKFAPAGLTVMGTYEGEEEPKAITSGITWTITPDEGILSLGQTSVYVKATVNGIESNTYTVNDITVAAAPLEVNWDASSQSYSNEQSVTEATFNDIISAEFEGGKYYNTGTAVRVYGGKTFAIHATSGYKITSIVIGFGTGDNSNTITADCGTYSNGTWTGSAKDVKFTVDGGSGHRRLKTFTVTYAVAGASVATPTITPSTEAETYWEPITVTLATETEGAAIYYTTNGDAPTTASTLYENPINVNATTTIKAIAVKEGLENSEVASKTFTFGLIYESLADLVAADITDGTIVKVSFENAKITGFYTNSQGKRYGVYLNTQKDDNDIEIYCTATEHPEEWAVNGTLSGTLVGKWTKFNSTWEICPDSWNDLTYTASKEISSIKISGTATKNVYTEGESFNDYSGLTVTATYTDQTTEDVTGMVTWSVDPSTALTTSVTSVTVTATINGVSDNMVVNITVNPEPAHITWDLTKDETATASADEISWTSDVATMKDEKGKASTDANNYYPGKGTPSNPITSTRFYKNSVLTITPIIGKEISSIVFEATTNGYAKALKGSTWINATASMEDEAEGTTVIVTPTNGKTALSATIGGTCGFTSVTVYYDEYEVSANMAITAAKWGTFCAPFDVTIPEGVKAYTADASGSNVAFTEVNGTIEAGTPVVAYSEEVVNQNFAGAATVNTNECTSGALVGVYAATTGIAAEDGYTNYVLQNNSNVVGFYKATSTISLKANRCYMTLPTSSAAKDGFSFEEIITGINEILNPTKKSAEGIFDLNGRKLAAPQKGINIINGVKVIVK